MDKTLRIEITPKSILTVLLILLGLQALWIVRDLIISLVIAFIFMSAFNPIVSAFEDYKIPRSLSTLGIFIVFIGLVSYLFATIFPPVVLETANLLSNLPRQLESVNTLNVPLDLSQLERYVPSLTDTAFDVASKTVSNVLFIVTTLFFSYYLLVEEHAVRSFALRFFEKKKAHRIADMIALAQHRVRDWLWGELILMLAVGIFTYVGLLLVGVRYALPLAVIAGLLEVVPIVGPIISAIPALIIGLSTSAFMGVSVAAFYFIVQQVENQILVPMVMKKTLGLNPVVTLAALIIGGRFAGISGMLLAIPVMVFVESILYESDVLKKPKQHTELPPGSVEP